MNIARPNSSSGRPRAWRAAPVLLLWAAVLALAGQVGQPLAQFVHESVAHAGAATTVDHHDDDAPADQPSDGGHGGHPGCLICQHLASLASLAVAPGAAAVDVVPPRRWSNPAARAVPARPIELTPVRRRGPPSLAC